ncbi:MAG: archaetidylserine decarboxylase [Woeseia sp.]
MLRAHAFLCLQHLTPKYLLTALVRWLAGIRLPAVKNFMIRNFVRLYKVDVDDVARPVPEGFADFNDFFTRELAEGARPIDSSSRSIVSPVDGIVSAAGPIIGDRLLQAKGIDYRLEDLLATDLADAAHFENGAFATIYLAPFNYHRVHSPLAGRLTALRYVPGSLYSVNEMTVQARPGLFTRNERLVALLETDRGSVPIRMAIVLVGALNVGSITTPWTGTIRPQKSGVVSDLTPPETAAVSPEIDRGSLCGWFNMGSTVIVLLPPQTCRWHSKLRSGNLVTMGEAIGTLIDHTDRQ